MEKESNPKRFRKWLARIRTMAAKPHPAPVLIRKPALHNKTLVAAPLSTHPPDLLVSHTAG